jgi:hypothetical protein
MLGKDPVEPKGFRGARKLVEGSVALAKRDDVIEVVDDGEKVAEAPDSGLIDRERGGATLLPEPAESARVGKLRVGGWSIAIGQRRPGIDDVIEAIAGGAAEYAIHSAAGDPGAALYASELMCRDFHGFS